MEQLQKMTDILHDEKYKNVTGLHKAMGRYIEKANKTATDEDERLKEEEAEVVSEKQFLEGRVCDFVWKDVTYILRQLQMLKGFLQTKILLTITYIRT